MVDTLLNVLAPKMDLKEKFWKILAFSTVEKLICIGDIYLSALKPRLNRRETYREQELNLRHYVNSRIRQNFMTEFFCIGKNCITPTKGMLRFRSKVRIIVKDGYLAKIIKKIGIGKFL